jgi:hypothetical protein
MEFISSSRNTMTQPHPKKRARSRGRIRDLHTPELAPLLWGTAVGERPRGLSMRSPTGCVSPKAEDSAAVKTSAPAVVADDRHTSEHIETTLGELIVALIEETHEVVDDERASYELVAYLLSARLTPRSSEAWSYRAGSMAASDGGKL